jgi:predicted dehydrogenase
LKKRLSSSSGLNGSKIMAKINWGIIGCGDVTEVKSGPAFHKVEHSALVAVMRRDAEKAKDYARRHNVPRWYANADELINDEEVSAVYVATPPSSHEELTLAALRAGKPVYVEKPMSTDAQSAWRMNEAAASLGLPLVVAHYRREQPLFKKIKSLIAEKAIGEVLYAKLELAKPPLTPAELDDPKIQWRIQPGIAGGGLFNDLSPHQLDLMYYFFGDAKRVGGFAANQKNQYDAEDIVAGQIQFQSGTIFQGIWSFNVPPIHAIDQCEITGTRGKIRFSFFNGTTIELIVDGITSQLHFETLQHVQQPMIEAVVKFFSGAGPNPCSGAEGAEIMNWIDRFTQK